MLLLAAQDIPEELKLPYAEISNNKSVARSTFLHQQLTKKVNQDTK
jgi:hypothetical protein